MKSIRLLLADDHTLVRAGIRSLLEKVPGVEVVGEASDGHEALDLVRLHRPSVVVTDLAMPGLNGLELVSRVTREFPGVRVVILSMHGTEPYVIQALRAGASAYLLKDSAPVELEVALRTVARGETYLSPPISRQVIEDYRRRVSSETSPLEQLTPRQREILQLISEGHTTRAIAGRLHVSVKTVETHRQQLMDRLDIHDVPGLVRFAIRVGLTTPDG